MHDHVRPLIRIFERRTCWFEILTRIEKKGCVRRATETEYIIWGNEDTLGFGLF